MSDIIYNERWAQDMMDKYDAIRAENAALKRENEAANQELADIRTRIYRVAAKMRDEAGSETQAVRDVLNLAALSRPSSSKAKQ